MVLILYINQCTAEFDSNFSWLLAVKCINGNYFHMEEIKCVIS